MEGRRTEGDGTKLPRTFTTPAYQPRNELQIAAVLAERLSGLRDEGLGLAGSGPGNTHCRKSFFIMLWSVRCRAGSWSSEDGARSQR